MNTTSIQQKPHCKGKTFEKGKEKGQLQLQGLQELPKVVTFK